MIFWRNTPRYREAPLTGGLLTERGRTRADSAGAALYFQNSSDAGTAEYSSFRPCFRGIFYAKTKNPARKIPDRIIFKLFHRGAALHSKLRLTNESFPAAGTADGNFTLTSGHPNHLTALGAVEVTVFPVLQPIKKLQELPVLLIPLIGISGEGAGNCPDHQTVGNRSQKKIHHRYPDERSDQGNHHAGDQNRHIESVRTVTAGPKLAELIAHMQ